MSFWERENPMVRALRYAPIGLRIALVLLFAGAGGLLGYRMAGICLLAPPGLVVPAVQVLKKRMARLSDGNAQAALLDLLAEYNCQNIALDRSGRADGVTIVKFDTSFAVLAGIVDKLVRIRNFSGAISSVLREGDNHVIVHLELF